MIFTLAVRRFEMQNIEKIPIRVLQHKFLKCGNKAIHLHQKIICLSGENPVRDGMFNNSTLSDNIYKFVHYGFSVANYNCDLSWHLLVRSWERCISTNYASNGPLLYRYVDFHGNLNPISNSISCSPLNLKGIPPVNLLLSSTLSCVSSERT